MTQNKLKKENKKNLQEKAINGMWITVATLTVALIVVPFTSIWVGVAIWVSYTLYFAVLLISRMVFMKKQGNLF